MIRKTFLHRSLHPFTLSLGRNRHFTGSHQSGSWNDGAAMSFMTFDWRSDKSCRIKEDNPRFNPPRILMIAVR